MLQLNDRRITSFVLARQFLGDALTSGLIEELLEEAKTRVFDTGDAYVHPNGFWKVRLHGRSLGRTQVRLHYWPMGTGAGDVHDHGWPYASLALRGSGVEQSYVEGAGEPATAFSYRPADSGTFALGWVKHETRIDPETTLHVMPGQFSGGEASHIHTFTAETGSELLTLVATGEPMVEYSRVFMAQDTDRIESLEPAALSRAQIDGMLSDARASLAAIQSSN
jgi:hypothetical protein